MGRFSQYGLDEKKKAKDSGRVNEAHWCLWCNDSNIKAGGFSLCFSNFIICKRCVESSADEANKDRWEATDYCFKCKKGAKSAYRTHSYIASSLHLCSECMQWARDVLFKNSNDMENKNVEPAVAESTERKCRVCGCTEENCQQCIEKTGEPCYWVEDDLCSACAAASVEENKTDPPQPLPLAENVERLVPGVEKFVTISFMESTVIGRLYDAKVTDLSDSELERAFKGVHGESERIITARKMIERGLTVDQVYAHFQDEPEPGFFSKLIAMGGVDMTMRIMQKGDRLTINIMPGAGSASIKPVLVTGTGPELDAGFFSTIAPGVKEIAGLVTNLEEVKKEVKEKAAAPKPEAKKPDPPKREEKPKAEKPAREEKNKIEEPLLNFG